MVDKTKPIAATKAQLADALNQREGRINDLQDSLRELTEIKDRTVGKLKDYEDVLAEIVAIHQPYVDMTRLLPANGFKPTITLRCTVCKTKEHHTWGNDNDEMWPCATLRLFVNTAESPIEVTQ